MKSNKVKLLVSTSITATTEQRLQNSIISRTLALKVKNTQIHIRQNFLASRPILSQRIIYSPSKDQFNLANSNAAEFLYMLRK
jgi:hypothetical protein